MCCTLLLSESSMENFLVYFSANCQCSVPQPTPPQPTKPRRPLLFQPLLFQPQLSLFIFVLKCTSSFFPPCFFSFQAPSYCADIVTLCFLKSCTEEEAFTFSLFYIIRLLWNSSVFPVVCGCWGQSTHSWYSKPSSRARTRSSPPPFYLPIPFILLLQICSIEGSAQTPVRAFKNDQLIQSKKSVFDSKFLDS